MNSLSGFNTQEIRRLHPYLSALLRRVKELEDQISGSAGSNIIWGTDNDILPTGRSNLGGTLNKVARADHQHLFRFPIAIPLSTPDGSAYFDIVSSAIKIYVDNAPTTRVVAGALPEDVFPTGSKSVGSAPRYAFADHSHPTAIYLQDDPQPPVVNEIRYNANYKIVLWDGATWVPLSVETFQADWGTDDDVQPTKFRQAGVSTLFARADHSHPTALLPQDDTQTPVADEIRYNTNNRLVRWDGSNWVEMSGGTVEWATQNDVQPTKLKSTGTTTRFARADHSHPTAILPQSDSQTPVVDEIRYTGTNQLVRWNGSAWVNFAGSLPVPADPLILPYDTQVSSPQNRQLVNRTAWDNIGNATVFYRDVNNNQYRLIFARPLVVCTTSTPSGKDVWTNEADELVLKEGTGFYRGGVLWRRRGNTQDWSPVSVQLSDEGTSFPSDVGVLIRSSLTGTSGSRRWFLRGVQEGGSFRAPFAGIATFTASNTPAHGDLATNLQDGYAYFIRDLDRVDIVKPETDGNKYCTMLPHYIIAPPCRIFSTATDPSGHYVVDELWNNIWVIAYYTTNSATTDLTATLTTITVPFGIRAGRVLLYLHNPQSSAITTVFAVSVRTPTSTGVATSTTSNTSVNISANTTTVADLGYLTFDPSTTLSHHRSHPVSISVIRRKSQETTNGNKVICLGVAIVPQRAS
jgi:hypothetical protein